MTINPDSFDNPENLFFMAEPEEPSREDLMTIVQDDLAKGCAEALTENDVEAHILVSAVANGVFVAAFNKTKDGEYQLLDLPVTAVYEMWKLKQAQIDPPKFGGWISLEFMVEKGGPAQLLRYNWDKPVYASSVSPENWYIRPEVEDEDNKPIWSDEQYKADGIDIP